MDNDVLSLLKRIRTSDSSSPDDEAFALLAEMYEGVVRSAVNRFSPSFGIGQDNDGAYAQEDLRQYALLALYRAADTYNEDEKGRNVSFGLYAKVCINNALISALRKYRTEKKRREAARTAFASRKTESDPLGIVIDSEQRSAVVKTASRVLSKYEKEIFDYYIAGKSVREIAERLGKDEKSVSNAVYRIKVKIRGLLKNQ